MNMEEGIMFILNEQGRLKTSEILKIADILGIWTDIVTIDIRQTLIEALQRLRNKDKIIRLFDVNKGSWYFSKM